MSTEATTARAHRQSEQVANRTGSAARDAQPEQLTPYALKSECLVRPFYARISNAGRVIERRQQLNQHRGVSHIDAHVPAVVAGADCSQHDVRWKRRANAARGTHFSRIKS